LLDLLVSAPAQASVRALLFAGIMGMIGALLAVWRLAPAFDQADARHEADRRARSLFRLAAALTSLAIAARLVQQAAAFADTPAEWPTTVSLVVTQTTWGIGWVVQALALPVAAFLEPGGGRHAPVRAWLLGLVLVALAATPALSGHAVGAPRLSSLAVVLDATHVLAASAWIGTLATLAIVALPLARRTGSEATLRLLARFSPIALTSAALLAATGLFASWLHLESIGALLKTEYGQMLLRKLVLLAGVVAAGAYNWKVATPRLAAGGDGAELRRSVAIELALAVAVVAMTAVLVATPLPAES